MKRIYGLLAAALTTLYWPEASAQEDDPLTYCVEQAGWQVCRADGSFPYRVSGLIGPDEVVYTYTLSRNLVSEDGREITWHSSCVADQRDPELPFHRLFHSRWPESDTEYHISFRPPGAERDGQYIARGQLGSATLGTWRPAMWLSYPTDGTLELAISYQFAGSWSESKVSIELSDSTREVYRLYRDLCDIL